MISIVLRFAAVLSLAGANFAYSVGADLPWTTYEAEKMMTTGVVLGPNFGPNMVEAESSGQQCVTLNGKEYVEFKVSAEANALVVRYSLVDAKDGGGLDSTLSLYQNGKLIQKLRVTSRYTRLYGHYPFTNKPESAFVRNFYDEARLKDLAIKAGDVLRLEKEADEARSCVIDLVDLENIAPPLAAPTNSLSLIAFGVAGKGEDATTALTECIAAARKEGKAVWVPAGTYKLTGDIEVPANTTIAGAGMWHTTFVGDDAQYSDASKRVRFNGKGGNIHIADFAIIGKLNYRNDTEINDGFGDTFGSDSTIARIWIEHTKVGVWVNNTSNLVVDGCRFRNTIADGLNFCVGVRNSTAQNCTTRGTGDDCFAIWPATHIAQELTPGHNVIRRCTGQLTFLANGAAIYGGDSNRIEDCLFTDILSGCGILLSTTFPTSNDHFDNNFSGKTVVRNCDLIRTGGFDPWRAWRSAFQLCLDRRNISGVEISNLNIKDSIADGFSVVASEGENGNGTLTDASLDNVNIPNCSTGTHGRHPLWIRRDAYGSLTIRNSKIAEVKNSSVHFNIKK